MSRMRHSSFLFLALTVAASFLWGEAMLWFGFVFSATIAVGLDRILPPDIKSHDTDKPWLLNAFLFAVLPLVYLNILFFNWQMSPRDLLGIGAFVQDLTGIDILSRKADRSLWQTIGAYASLGLLMTSGGTTVAHELVHRIWSPFWVAVGRWLLAPTLDTSFAIEHVYGHHANVATWKDPASSRRGENVFAFFIRSTVFCNVGAWDIEKKRLAKREQSGPWTPKNFFLRGQLMSLVLLLFYVWAQGSFGILSFLIIAVYGKFWLELVNYIEHYGLVRVPGRAVEIKHSWNCNHRFSLWFLFNLPRHSHHHAKGHLPFWKLQSHPSAPTLPFGYMTMIIFALMPPVFRWIMKQSLEQWDRVYASEDELRLIRGPVS